MACPAEGSGAPGGGGAEPAGAPGEGWGCGVEVGGEFGILEQELGRGDLGGRDLESVFGVFGGGGKLRRDFSVGTRLRRNVGPGARGCLGGVGGGGRVLRSSLGVGGERAGPGGGGERRGGAGGRGGRGGGCAGPAGTREEGSDLTGRAGSS